MQIKNLIFYLFFFFIILTGCSSSQGDETISFVEVNGSQVMVCDMDKIKEKKILRLSELVESCELIRLEDVDDALFKAVTITVTDNYIGVRQSGKPYKLFSRSGKYLGNIGTVGQGPGEYINFMYDEIIDEKNGYIYLMPFLDKKMLIYDITGKHIKDIPLPSRMNKPKMMYDNGLFTIIQLPIYEADILSIQIDLDGTVLQESLPPKIYVCRKLYRGNSILSTFGCF
ncbi:6-bladed beta-propeller [Parabacteroides sp. OttesenSCG-928-G07]|nr:6-bladed beta-propeller [Parabacteroides sp. OttesenSCG-928-G21]MDL2278557.1 6-bladed beta-propeller [Parabacteroides sp. OttesenSCG-928-G07]